MRDIILLVRRGVYEVEWILPVLILLKKNYNIYTYFYTQDAFDSLQNSQIIFKLWLNYSKNFYIRKKYNKFFFRILRYILIKTNIFKSLSKKLTKKIHNINEIKLNLGINEKKKLQCILADHQNYNPLLNEFYIKKIKVILFPSSPAIYVNNSLKKTFKKKILSRYLLVNDKVSYKFFIKNFNLKYTNTIITGVPQFENWYIKKIRYESQIKKNKKKKKIVIAYSFLPTATNNCKSLCIKQLSSILELLSNYNNLEIVLKLHAFKKDKYYQNFFVGLKKKNIKISDNNIIQEMLNADILIVNYKTSASLYGPLFKVPTITLWDPNFEFNRKIYGENYHDQYVKYGLSFISTSLKDLQKYIDSVIKYSVKIVFWENQIKNFNKTFLNNQEIPTKKILNLINERQ